MKSFFKWNMLITSFIPLWLAIIFINLWDIFYKYDFSWLQNEEIDFFSEILGIYLENIANLSYVFIIIIVLLVSLRSISKFLKIKSNKSESTLRAKIVFSRKSKTIVTDFILTYILPMVAFNFSNLRDIILFLLYPVHV